MTATNPLTVVPRVLELASRSTLASLGLALQARTFVKLARTIRRYREGILAAIRLGLSNGRDEGLNSKRAPISHRSFGIHAATP